MRTRASSQDNVSHNSADDVPSLLNAATTPIGDSSGNYNPNVALSISSLTQSPPSTRDSRINHSLPCNYDSFGLGGISQWIGSDVSQPLDGSDQLGRAPSDLGRSEATGLNVANPWAISPGNQIPGWLVSEDFDLSALNAHIPPSANNLDCMDWSSHGLGADAGRASQASNNIVIHSPLDFITEPREEYIRRQWFTYISLERTGNVTPDVTNEPTSVDERYRENLCRELRQRRIHDEPLPSTDYLVSHFSQL